MKIQEPEFAEETEELESLKKEKKKGLRSSKIRGKQGHQHTKDEVSEAVKKFLIGGGTITKVVSEYLEEV